jgi:hypothetical protein
MDYEYDFKTLENGAKDQPQQKRCGWDLLGPWLNQNLTQKDQSTFYTNILEHLE